MPTANRAKFVERTVAYFARQTYSPRELVVVDDGDEPVEHLCNAPFVRYLRAPGKLTQGAKLNFGIDQALGEYIIKWDDDDWQHPELIATLLKKLGSARSSKAIAACGCHLVFFAGETILHRAPKGCAVGGTLTFSKNLWRRFPFRDLNVGEDYWFRKETGEHVVRVHRHDLYVVVRHGANTWLRSRDGQRLINDTLRAMPVAAQTPATLFSPEELAFYLSLPPVK